MKYSEAVAVFDVREEEVGGERKKKKHATSIELVSLAHSPHLLSIDTQPKKEA